MPVYQGTVFTKNFILENVDTGDAIDISGWGLRAMLRDRVEDEEALVELTSDNGGLTVTDGPAGQMTMVLTADQTAALPIAKIVFDVLRTDIDPGPKWLFGGRFPVKQPVTRDD